MGTHTTTVEQMLLNERHDEFRRDEFAKMHPEIAREFRKEMLVVEALMLREARRWRTAYPKDAKRAVWEPGAVFRALYLDPDAELLKTTEELVELELEALQEKQLRLPLRA